MKVIVIERRIVALLTASLLACSRTPPPASTSVAGDAQPAAHPVTAEANGDAGAGDAGSACAGDDAKGVTCLRFATAEDAFLHVLKDDVAVLAIGEAHAQKGTEAIASATKRFTDELLPIVAGRSADIVVELWAPDPKCQKEVKQVASAQKPVTQAQAAETQNEYVTLGTKAKALGVTPWLLRPTCDDFAALADAGADAVPAMLGLVKRLTQDKVEKLLAKNAKEKKTTIAYGGALHNDVTPPEATAAYSFGPELTKITGGAYVELDLIVPEYVKKTPAWEKLPWFQAWQAEQGPAPHVAKQVTLYVISNAAAKRPSYVLIFAASPV